jgi:hypothetical protein
MLYHADIYVPAGLPLPGGPVRLRYTRHARDEAANDRYLDLTPHLPEFLDPDLARLVEVRMAEGRLDAVLYRTSATELFDAALLVRPDGDDWVVITVWANRWDDHHSTLDVSKYEVPPEEPPVNRELRSKCRSIIRQRRLVDNYQDEDRVLDWLFHPCHDQWGNDFDRLVRLMGGDRKQANQIVGALSAAL